MNSSLPLLPAAALLAWAVSTALAQGPLTPSGAPAASMKRLDQIEPRIDLATLAGDETAQIVIAQPGSYYLSANLTGVAGKHGIRVASSNVVIDLHGFQLGGTSESLNGIQGNDQRITVRNGRVANWNTGVFLGAFCALENVTATVNRAVGLHIDTASTVRGCTAIYNSGKGFECTDMVTLTDCLAFQNVGVGFEAGETATLTRCSTRQNGGAGFSLGGGSNLQQCASQGDNSGFVVGGGSTLRDCSARFNGVYGFSVGTDCSLAHCVAVGTGAVGTVGLDADSGSTLTACSAGNFPVGIRTSSACTVIGSTARNCADFGIAVAASASLANCAVRDSGVGINASTSSSVTGCAILGGNIGILADTGASLTGNTVRNTTSFGLQFNAGNVAAGNAVYGSAATGIYGNYSNIIDRNNSLLSRHYGIYATYSSTVTNNLSTYSGTNEARYSGLGLFGNCRAEGNHLIYNTSYGIYSPGINANTVSDYILRNTSRFNGGSSGAFYNADYYPSTDTLFGILANPNSAGVTGASNH